jgi:hypothetical protein
MAGRLSDEATRLADQFFTICVRALDYCPPVDITFGSYLRAVLTADFDLHPQDDIGMRDALMQSFRLRGILPEGAEFFSEASIRWPRALADLPTVDGLDFGDPNGLMTQEQKNNVGGVLRQYIKANTALLKFKPGKPFIITSFHPVFRITADGSLRTDMVVQVVQSEEKPFNEKVPEFGSFPLRGGATLIIRKPVTGEKGAKENKAPVRYVISRHLSDDRADRPRRFGEHLGIAGSNDPRRFDVNFAMVHEGV